MLRHCLAEFILGGRVGIAIRSSSRRIVDVLPRPRRKVFEPSLTGKKQNFELWRRACVGRARVPLDARGSII